MSLDYIYLQSIRELEEENKVEFPRDVVNAFAVKNFTCEYNKYSDQVTVLIVYQGYSILIDTTSLEITTMQN